MIAAQALDTSSGVSRRSDILDQASTLGTVLPGRIPLAPMPSTKVRQPRGQGANKFTLTTWEVRRSGLIVHKTDTHPYQFHGERFDLEIDDGVLSLRHPRWSLMGTGKTLIEAETDLLDEAREVAHAMLELPIATLSFEAFRLREFLLRII